MSLTTQPSVIGRLEGEDCQWCHDGRLKQGTYKGNDAVVCDACETPAAQLW
ncbi:HVO_A0556 family zinc finger protein [Haladaptatus litoreus]|nr:HVO_A0556 family zinc finger protein [Haladaptatus litoreus]